MSSRVEPVQTPEGSFDLAVWLPEAGTGPGLLLIQEIYGVSDYIQAVAEDLAGLGYVVAAPDLFWRLKPGHVAAHDEAGLTESLAAGVTVRLREGRRGRDGGTARPDRAARGDRRHRGDRILPGRIHRLLPGRAGGAGRHGLVLRLRGPRQPGAARADRGPAAVPVRRQRPVHPARAGRAGGRGSRGPAQCGNQRRGERPGTRSTTGWRRCSTYRNRPPGPGSAPRSSWPAISRSGTANPRSPSRSTHQRRHRRWCTGLGQPPRG